MSWHDRPAGAALDDLDTDATGLSSSEAERRLETYGPNEIEAAEGRSPVEIFLSQFDSVLIWVLLAAAGLSIWVGHTVDAVLIALIVVADGVFGFVQDYRAEQSIQALREMATPTATVVRDGERREVDVRDVVPGDVVVLKQGDSVPADARLVEASSLEVDESALTGESVPVEKDTDPVAADAPLAERQAMVYKQTTVARGRGQAVVVETGMDTEVGEIATAIATAEERETPFQRDLDRLGRRLGLGILALSVLVMPILVVRGTALVDAGLAAISLAVAAIPEGLPAVVTLTLALGVRKMAAENALVRQLPVVESLGSVDVVCTDKTGTLTEGDMRAHRAWVHDRVVDLDDAPDGDSQLQRLLLVGAVCNDADLENGDPTERALVRAAAEYGLDVSEARNEHPRVDERAFTSDRRRMATIHEEAVYVKGAPEELLARSNRVLTADGPRPLDEATRASILEQCDAFAGQALRVLAFAYKGRGGDPETDLVFVGLQGLQDPPRPEVRDAIAETRRAGIDVKMLTGDNRLTARSVGEQVGIESEVVEGRALEELDGDDLRETIATVDIFARVEPKHKVKILQSLQAEGHIVAMTGDGVNDAPALKNADVGISMGERGTDVAKQSSDIILLDDNYATITTAVRRGRTIFDNVWKFVAYLLSANLAEVLLVFVASLYGYLILPAVLLLWINLLTDGLPALAVGADPESGDVMDHPPREKGSGVIDRQMVALIVGIGVTATVILLGVMVASLDGAPDATAYARTMVFTGFVVFEFGKLYVVRWVRETPTTANRWLTAAVGVSMALQLAVLYTPLNDYFGVVPLTLADWRLLGVAFAVAVPAFAVVGALSRRVVPPR